ncbi:MAG TPA: STN domain-containing protein, partial [Sunxiuqinia sp.]|nr:STN domain-containing protein [Sunxiuqinia sp.]
MRTTLFVLFVTIAQTFAIGSYSQNSRMSLKMHNSSIKDVLKEIENKSDLYFMYDATKVDVSQDVNINCDNMLVTQILDRIFEKTDITYKVNNRQIALSNRNISSTATQNISKVAGQVTSKDGEPIP